MTLTVSGMGRDPVHPHREMSPQHKSALRTAIDFVRQHRWKFISISLIVLIPCFWHRRIEAGDLGSHTYNAWLEELIQQKRLPGLWIAKQSTNVLFDYLLSGFGSVLGLRVAEKIAVSLSVLIFFWGVFGMVAASAKRAPWFLIPLIAIFTYGWTFEMGFLNYYLSLGLSFFGLAIFWRGVGWERLLALAFLPFIWLAHPIGFVWLLGAAVYIAIAEILKPRYHVVLLSAAAASLLLMHYLIALPFRPFDYTHNGLDQMWLFGLRYLIPMIGLALFAYLAILADAHHRWGDSRFWRKYLIPFEMFVIAQFGILVLPEAITFHHRASLALIPQRLSLLSAIIICCLIGQLEPRKWHLLALTAIAAVFFSFLYQDTGALDRTEARIEQVVQTLPSGQRVWLESMPDPPHSHVAIEHILDRACIGRCFSYLNYEPSSGQFRVRAQPGNLFVVMNDFEENSAQTKTQALSAEEITALQAYPCGARALDMCVRVVGPIPKNSGLPF
jgi:hypothetical protein